MTLVEFREWAADLLSSHRGGSVTSSVHPPRVVVETEREMCIVTQLHDGRIVLAWRLDGAGPVARAIEAKLAEPESQSESESPEAPDDDR